MRGALDALVDNAARVDLCAPEVVSILAAGFRSSATCWSVHRVVDDVAEHGERCTPRSRPY